MRAGLRRVAALILNEWREVVRAPFLGAPVHAASWLWSIGLLIVGFALAQLIMRSSRNKLAYWL